MQNRYVGDIGDFAKYGMLRQLCQPLSEDEPSLRLGIVWYLVPDEGHNNDGKFTHYLEPTRENRLYECCDSSLYRELASIVRSGGRTLQRIQSGGLLPPDTQYHDLALDLAGLGATADRMAFRQEWVSQALAKTMDSDLIFVDPDNGLERKTSRHSRKKGGKFAFFDEIRPFLDRGQSVVIYQHFCRQGSYEEQMNHRFHQTAERLGNQYRPFALRWRRVSGRAFIVVPRPEHRDVLLRLLARMLQSNWAQHFEPYGDWGI